MELKEFTFLAFALFNSLRLFSYLPQIIRIAGDQNGASAISFTTWSLWTACHLATGAYAAVNLHDMYLTAASALFAICCVAVIGLTAVKRRKFPALTHAGNFSVNFRKPAVVKSARDVS